MTEEQRSKYLHDEQGDTRTNDEIYRLIQIDGLQAQLYNQGLTEDRDKLRKQLDYKTEENKQNILTINDLRKRCEDLEAALKESKSAL